jgi:hypothetical protein
MMPAESLSAAKRSAVPRLLLPLLMALLVVLIASGLALAVLHTKPSIAFSVLSYLHIQAGLLFMAFGALYLVAHTVRIGASRKILPWVVLAIFGFFGLFVAEVPPLAATTVGVLSGGALAAWLWWRSSAAYAWQSFASAIGVMLVLGALIESGVVMALGWGSMRSNIYHWTHLLLTPVAPFLIWMHARARRRRAPSSAGYRLPRAWYTAVASVLVLGTAWVAYRTHMIARDVPSDSVYRTEPRATIHLAKEEVTLEGALTPELFQDPKGCAMKDCHVGPYRQWHGSAHRFASSTVAYERAAEAFIARRGRDAEVFCAKCHNPLAVASGAFARQDWEAVASYARDGVSCEGCHLREPPPVEYGRFSASFRILPDTPYPWVDGRTDLDYLRRDYLDVDPYFHRRKYHDEYIHTSEMCGACHGERHVDLAGNEIVLFDELAGLQRSGLEDRGITCQKCHNNLNAYVHLEELSMHARPDHRFPGIALDLPEAIPPGSVDGEPFLAQDLRETADFMRLFLDGEQEVSNYERVYLHSIGDTRIDAHEDFIQNRKVLDMSASARRGADGEVVLSVTSTNNKVGHDFPTGPPDLSQYWLEVLVQSPGGGWRPLIGHDPSTGAIDPRAPRLGGRVFDKDGLDLREHAIDRVGRVELWVIPFAESRTHEIVLDAAEVPHDARLRAEWRYRRYNPEFSRWAWRDDTKLFPAHPLASVEVDVPSIVASN